MVKELMMYDELNLTEISYKLSYSSVGHLSHQFKHVTGLTPSYYKQLKQNNRVPMSKDPSDSIRDFGPRKVSNRLVPLLDTVMNQYAIAA